MRLILSSSRSMLLAVCGNSFAIIAYEIAITDNGVAIIANKLAQFGKLRINEAGNCQIQQSKRYPNGCHDFQPIGETTFARRFLSQYSLFATFTLRNRDRVSTCLAQPFRRSNQFLPRR